LDFDGTISVADTGVHLLERLGPTNWREVEALYDAGEIGSRECVVREWALLRASRDEIESVVREVPIDEGFEQLVEFLCRAGAEVAIISDGFGFRAEEVARSARVSVLTNQVDWGTGQLVFPNGDPDCECAECGACKKAPVRRAKARGRTTVLVGDGISDFKAATEVDIVFAKDGLAEWCERQSIPYLTFSGLSDVLGQLSDT
jgi:2-hydroxy-3-keto-5-methylthiopentenyl-1-phosphate phosphatase